jgi:tape measure domain-containing protein
VAKQRIINVVYKLDTKQIDESTKSVNKAKKATDDLTKSTKGTGDQGVKSFTSLRDAIVTTGLLALVGGLAKKIFDLGAAQQQTNVAFKTFLGSAERAKKLIAELTKFSIVTPFTPDQVFRSAKTLLAFGVEADKIIPTLKQLGDVSAGTGKDLTEMAVIFGQIRSTGRLMGQDLLQLINAGFNPLQVIAVKTGRSVADLKKDMEKGLISFDMVDDAFKSATSEGGLFFNLMEAQSQTVSGKLSTIQGNIEEIGKAIFFANEGPIGQTIGTIADLTSNVETLSRVITDYISKVSGPFQIGLALMNESLKLFTDTATEATEAIEELQEHINAADLTFDRIEDLNTIGKLEEKIKGLRAATKDASAAELINLGHQIKFFEAKKKILEGILKGEIEINKQNKQTEERDIDVPIFDFDPDKVQDDGEQLFQLQSVFNDRVKTALEEFGKELDAEKKDQADREYDALVEKNEKELEAIREAEEKKRELARLTSELIVDFTRQGLESILIMREVDTQSIIDKYDRELELAGDNDIAKEQIEQERDKKLQQAEVRNKQIQKQNARSKIRIDTAIAIIKTFSQFGYPAGIIPAAFMAGIAALQIRNVNKFAKGVIDLKGSGTTTSDSIPAMLSRRESVMTAEETISSNNILKSIRSKKLNDKVLDKISAKAKGGDGSTMWSDERIVKELIKNRPPDYVRHGSFYMEGRMKGEMLKEYILKRYMG